MQYYYAFSSPFFLSFFPLSYRLLTLPPLNYSLSIIARDGGNLTAVCSVLIEVYRFYDTVSAVLAGSPSNFNARLFSQLLSDMLGVEVEVATVGSDDDGDG